MNKNRSNYPTDADQSNSINCAQYHCGTKTLGPGYRSVLWVQGCERNCPGCVARHWAEIKKAHLISPSELAELLLEDPQITGITISGGEPMLQAKQLHEFICESKKIRDIDIICYSGYTFEEILRDIDHPERARLLLMLDVLIDGPYKKDLDDSHGLRGSTNQRVLFFTDRLAAHDFENDLRKIELHKEEDGELLMIGLPTEFIQDFLSKNLPNMQ